MLAEIAASYVPWIDNALDLISTSLALVGGALMMGGVLGDVPPYMRWTVAVIVVVARRVRCRLGRPSGAAGSDPSV